MRTETLKAKRLQGTGTLSEKSNLMIFERYSQVIKDSNRKFKKKTLIKDGTLTNLKSGRVFST